MELAVGDDGADAAVTILEDTVGEGADEGRVGGLDSRFTLALVSKLQCADCEVCNGVWFAARWCGRCWCNAHLNGLSQARGGEEERTEKASGTHLGMW